VVVIDAPYSRGNRRLTMRIAKAMVHEQKYYRERGSVVAKQVYGPLRPRDLDRADRRWSKGPDMTCSKERVLHNRYHVSFVPRVRH
jgi:hypothetical protein